MRVDLERMRSEFSDRQECDRETGEGQAGRRSKELEQRARKLARQMNGRPRSEIKPKLQALMNKLGLKLEHAQIDYFAEAIEQGKIPCFDAR